MYPLNIPLEPEFFKKVCPVCVPGEDKMRSAVMRQVHWLQ